MKRRSRLRSPLLAAFLIASLAFPPRSADALRPQMDRSGLEERLHAAAPRAYGPNGPEAGLEEAREPDEIKLIEHVDRTPASRILYRESGSWHVHRKNLNAVMGEKRAEQVVSLMKKQPVEIYAVPDDLIGRQGAWQSPDTETLYLGHRALQTADISLIRSALGDHPGPLREWAVQQGEMVGRPVTVDKAPSRSESVETPPTVPPNLSLGESKPSPVFLGKEASPAETLRQRLKGLYHQVMEEKSLLPNQVFMVETTEKGEFLFAADFSGSEGEPGFCMTAFPRRKNELTRTGLIPPLEQLRKPRLQVSRRYSVVVEKPGSKNRPKDKSLQYLEQLLKEERGRVGDPLLNPAVRDRLAGEISKAALNLSGRPSLNKQTSDPDASLRDAAQAVDEMIGRQLRYSVRATRVFWMLQQGAKARKKVPAGVVRQVLDLLEEEFSDFPRGRLEVQVYRDRILPAEGEEDLKHWIGLLDSWLDGAQQESLEGLLDVPSGALQQIYFDACRAALLDRIERGSAPEVVEAARRLAILEEEAGDSELIRDRADTVPARIHRDPLGGIGVLFLNDPAQPADKVVRKLVPGGGGYSGTCASTMRYADFRSFQVGQWYQPPSDEGPGDRVVVLLYPSMTGSPNFEQLYWFLEDAYRLKRKLPGSPDVWLGTVDKEGYLRLYRPKADLADKDAWRESYRPVMYETKRAVRFLDSAQDVVELPDYLTETGPSGFLTRFSGMAKPMSVPERIKHQGVWLRERTGGLAALIQRELEKVHYGAPVAKRIMDVTRKRFKRELEEIKEPRADNAIHHVDLKALLVILRLFVSEQITAPLMDEGFETVRIEGLTKPEPAEGPSGKDSAGAPADVHGREDDSSDATDPDQVGGIVRGLVEWASDPKQFGLNAGTEAAALATEWVPQQLAAGQKIRRVDFGKELERRLAAQAELAAGREREFTRLTEETIRESEAALAQGEDLGLLTAALGRLASQKKHSPKLQALKDKLEAAIHQVGERERRRQADASRQTREAASLAAAQAGDAAFRQRGKRVAQMEDQERNRILSESQSPSEVAAVLRYDPRFQPLFKKDTERLVGKFLDSLLRGEKPGKLGAVRRHAQEGRAKNYPFFNAVIRLADLAESAGLEEGGGEALEGMDWFLEENRDNPAGLIAEAGIRIDQGAPTRALPLLDRAIEIDPQSAIAYQVRARAEIRISPYHVRALPDADRAIALNPEVKLDPAFAGAYIVRARVEVQRGRSKEAIRDATRALELDPESVEARMLRVQANRRLRRMDDVRSDTEEVLRRRPSDILAHVFLSEALDQQGKKIEAERLLLRAISLEPGRGRTHYTMGLHQLRWGNRQKAYDSFSKAFGLNSGDWRAHEWVRRLEAEMGRPPPSQPPPETDAAAEAPEPPAPAAVPAPSAGPSTDLRTGLEETKEERAARLQLWERLLQNALKKQLPVEVYIKRTAVGDAPRGRRRHHVGAVVSLSPNGESVGFLPLSNFVQDPGRRVPVSAKLHRLLWYRRSGNPIQVRVERTGKKNRPGAHMDFIFSMGRRIKEEDFHAPSSTRMEGEDEAEAYREGARKIARQLAEPAVESPLSPGEVWMLGQLADVNGHVALGALDQRLEEWVPPMEEISSGVEQDIWDVRYRMAIAAELLRSIADVQSNPAWANQRGFFGGQVGFLFGRNVIEHPEFKRLREGTIPLSLKEHMRPKTTLKDVRFLAQGDDPLVPRWKPARAEMTVEEAIASGAVGYKTVVMLPTLAQGQAYSPYWQRLIEENLAWVQQRAMEAKTAGDGLGFGYVAGAILWPAPPADFVPGAEALRRTGYSPAKLQDEMSKNEPADWALRVVMEEWLKSSRKDEVEAGSVFAQAHAALTRRIVADWSKRSGITLIQVAGPYFVEREAHLRERVVQAQQAIQDLAEMESGAARGKVIPSTRNRRRNVYRAELAWMANAGLAGGVTAGRSMLQSMVDRKTGRFYRLNQHLFRQGAVVGAVDLLNGVETLRKRQALGVWSAYGIPRAQAERLITAARRPAEAGLEEAEPGQATFARRVGEAVSRIDRNVVVLVDGELFDPAIRAELTDLTLVGLGMALRKDVLPWPEESAADLQIVVVSEENRQATLNDYSGWRVIEVKREEGTSTQSLPVAALPRVVADALATGADLLEIDVTPYLDLGGMTLDEALENLHQLIFA